ncbi:MAG TPA: nitroreductase family protein, partial [Methanocella sp.]|nr:nitroreductase family protein [Methanocella sp.]
MDVFKAIETRRSIRKYQGRSIPDELMNKIFEAGQLAPSAANRQPWGVVAVRSPDTKKSAASACNNCDYVAHCDVLLVCFGDPRDRWYEVDAAVALENMALVAWENGIGSCFIGYFNEDYLKSLLHIPPDMKVVACLTLGFPDESPAARPRKGIDDLVFREKYTVRGSSPPF